MRENLFLLRIYSIALLVIFLGQLVAVGLGYYYSDKVRTILNDVLAEKVIENYRENDDFTNIVDSLQEHFECCGISIDGYRYY